MVDASTRWIRPAARRSGSTFAPRRHRRTSSSPVRTAGVVATAVAGLLFFVFALFAADSEPIGPEAPFGALPPTASPDVTPRSAPPGDKTPDASDGAAPANRYPGALTPPVSVSRSSQPAAQPAAAEPFAAGPAAAEPSPAPPQPAVPQPSPAPAAPEPGSQPPAPPSPIRPDDSTPPGNGKPKGNPSPPGQEPKPKAPKVDPRYATCEDVLAAGLGPYKAGRDEEYAWYPDPDANGWACEKPRWGLGRK